MAESACTCGYEQSKLPMEDSLQSIAVIVEEDDVMDQLDSSFVHLHHTGNSLLQSHDLIQQRERRIAYEHIIEQLECGELPDLCVSCMERCKRALDQDTERLDRETTLYLEDAKARTSQQYQRFANDSCNAIQDEIEELKHAIEHQRENELAHSRALLQEQKLRSDQLTVALQEAEEEMNRIELEAGNLDDDIEDTHRRLKRFDLEAYRLTRGVRLLSISHDLEVDKAGRLYPRINDLRLAYQPQRDVTGEEVSAAWSLVAQLVLAISTMMQFQSGEFRIVGSNLMRKASNGSYVTLCVGHVDNTPAHRKQALQGWNALLFQLCQWTREKIGEHGVDDTAPPFQLQPDIIDGVSLKDLASTDTTKWSRVIHCWATNLWWLSELTSWWVQYQVHIQSTI